MIQNEHIEEFLRQAHRVGDAGLTVCSSGNLSWRVGDEVLVSGTGSWVPSLTKDKVAVCRLETGEILNGVKPSMESVFHLGVLRERPDVNVVLPYFRPGSKELAEVVIAAMKDHNSVLLQKHGQVVCGKDFNQAFERAVFFEMACRIIVLSGGKYKTLTKEEIDDLETYILGKKTK